MPATRADSFPPLPADRLARWGTFGSWDRVYFPSLVGIELEEVRQDYSRMRLPYRAELSQAAGRVHGGVIATLIDTVVVPAIGGGYDGDVGFATIDLHVQYHGAVVDEDMVAEGWVTRRGRSIVFCEAEVTTTAGASVARGALTYKVSIPPPRSASV
jgi:uncharacterized protein (TIGR00369 family)